MQAVVTAGNIIILFIFGLLPLLLLFWIYGDAEENGQSGCLWVILVMIFSYPALIVYLLLFHGMPAMRRPSSPRRDEDLQYRSMYRSEISDPGTKYPNTWGEPSKMVSAPKGDADFFDEELDKLIMAGKISEARKYMRDMISMAKEMGDSKGMANYKLYESRINRAAGSGAR